MLEQPTEEVKEIICNSFNTSVSQVHQDVATLKQWIQTQPHLPQCSSDTMLTLYLLACKNRMDRAKEKIDNYYTVRNQMHELFADRDPLDKKIQDCGKEIKLYTMPKLTPDGCRISASSFVTGDPKKYDVWAYSKRIMMLEDIKNNEDCYNRGLYYVYDCKLFSMGHVLRITPKLVRNLIYCAQDVLPVIIKAIIFINAPTYLDIVIKLIKPIMKSKLFQRVHVHTEGAEVLGKYFPVELLPKDYGGEEDTSDNLNEAWMRRLEENRDWLLTDGSLIVDEKKRRKNKSKKRKDINDFDESFKHLSID